MTDKHMQNLKFLQLCPMWHLHSVITKTHWSQGVAEFFSENEHGEPTHIHWYCKYQQAVEVYEDLPRKTQEKINKMKTVSFKRKTEWHLGEDLSTRPDGYYLYDRGLGFCELVSKEEAIYQAEQDSALKVYEILAGEEKPVMLWEPGEESKQLSLLITKKKENTMTSKELKEFWAGRARYSECDFCQQKKPSRGIGPEVDVMSQCWDCHVVNTQRGSWRRETSEEELSELVEELMGLYEAPVADDPDDAKQLVQKIQRLQELIHPDLDKKKNPPF